MNDEFGILPLPKYNEKQSEYIASAQEQTATMFRASKTTVDPERTGIILEAMCSASASTITPAFYDTVLDRKVARDNESAEMLDIIFDSRTYDIVYTYNWGSIWGLANTLLADSNTITSSIASIKTSIESAYMAYLQTIK